MQDNMPFFTVIDVLKDAAEREKLCEIYYSKVSGQLKRYELQPYEIKEGYLFATDAGQTKRFKIHSIKRAAVVEKREWSEVEYARKIIGEKDGETNERESS